MSQRSASTGTERHEMNRDAWNEAAQQYESNIASTVAFLRAGGQNFDPPELTYLEGLAEWCRRAIHLQCAGGKDTLSLWNRGAGEVVGIDISDRMIEVARATSDAIGARAAWFRYDILEAPHELDATADLVYTGRGALGWIMDISAWASVVERLLRPGGRLYVYEGHPLDWVWDLNATTYQLEPHPPLGDYFSDAVLQSRGWPETYIDPAAVIPPDHQSNQYERQWTLGEIINSLVDAGLTLVKFEEHPDCYWNQFPNMPAETTRRLPHTFSLSMRKP